MKKTKALALLSGGLDSILAIKLIQNQGIEVIALNFSSPFCLCGRGGCGVHKTSEKLNVPLKTFHAGNDYLKIIKNPKHGYGKNLNPCLDCRIFMFTKARKYAKKIGASFIFTGEVLNERPMSQHQNAMFLIERKSGLTNKLLRPLSAKLLPETQMEKEGIVDRTKLLAINGRSRKPQIKLAKDFNLFEYPCPSGGCLLTYKEFAIKVQDLFLHKKRITEHDILILKIGRHFRIGSNKIIVGRNIQENRRLINSKGVFDFFFEVPNYGSPITLLQGRKTKKSILTAASLTAYYSDNANPKVLVNYGKDKLNNSIYVNKPNSSDVQKLRIESKFNKN